MFGSFVLPQRALSEERIEALTFVWPFDLEYADHSARFVLYNYVQNMNEGADRYLIDCNKAQKEPKSSLYLSISYDIMVL